MRRTSSDMGVVGQGVQLIATHYNARPYSATLACDIERGLMRAVAFAGFVVAVTIGACAVVPQPITLPTAEAPQAPAPVAAKCQGPGSLDIGDYAWVKDPKPDDIKNGGWEVCPGKVVMPATFCRWVSAVLPDAQLKTCIALHLKSDPAAYKAKWQIIKAENGAVYQIDLNSIRALDRGRAEAVIYIVEGDTFNPTNMKRMLFDCRGHMTDISGGNGPTTYVPPLSVGGQLAAIACDAAKRD
jgi:hypothetical protein